MLLHQIGDDARAEALHPCPFSPGAFARKTEIEIKIEIEGKVKPSAEDFALMRRDLRMPYPANQVLV